MQAQGFDPDGRSRGSPPTRVGGEGLGDLLECLPLVVLAGAGDGVGCGLGGVEVVQVGHPR